MSDENQEQVVPDEQLEEAEQEAEKQRQDELVPKQAYEQTKNDLHKFKNRYRETETQLKELQARLQQMEESKLEEKQEYKKLYEQQKQKAEQLDSEKKEMIVAFEYNKKMDAIEEAALKMGIRREAVKDLGMLDIDGVVVERTDQGRTMIVGAEDFVENLKKEKPYWFTSGKAPNINNSGGEYAQKKTVTSADVLKLQKTDKTKYVELMQKVREGKIVLQG